MKLSYVTGSATAPQGPGPKVICHCVNDVGRWGSGFVLAIDARWPHVKGHYREWHRTTFGPRLIPFATAPVGDQVGFHLGSVQFVEAEAGLYIANIVGQHRTIADGEAVPVRYPAIKMGLRDVATFCREHGASAHMPRLGAGLARGEWSKIAALIELELVSRDVAATVYDLR